VHNLCVSCVRTLEDREGVAAFVATRDLPLGTETSRAARVLTTRCTPMGAIFIVDPMSLQNFPLGCLSHRQGPLMFEIIFLSVFDTADCCEVRLLSPPSAFPMFISLCSGALSRIGRASAAGPLPVRCW
jgi:hypothetical protein